MSFDGFIDAYPPGHIKGFPFTASPRFSTDITSVKSGTENIVENWDQPLHRFTAPQAIRSQEDFEAVKDMWWVMGGPGKSFAFRDPMDCASKPMDAPNVPPVLSRTDQIIATTDGLTATYQLRKAYTFGDGTKYRTIYLPVVDSVLLGLDGLDPLSDPDGPFPWTVDRQGGTITFDTAPDAGKILTAGFLFDVRCRFEADDSFDGIAQTYRVAGFADLTFMEKRGC